MAESGERSDSGGRRGAIIFWSLLLMGVVLRLAFLGRASYMIDEINVIRDAVDPARGYGDIFRTELERFTWYHRLPLVMFLIRAASRLIGFEGPFPPEWITRLPFALMGVGVLPLFYFLGRLLKDRATGLWCMFLATFSVYLTYYSREAYDYSMVIFFVTGVLWSGLVLARWAGTGERFNWPMTAAYVVFASGLLQSHLGGLLFLGPWNILLAVTIGVTSGWNRLLKGNRPLYWIGTFGVPYLLFVPFLLKLFGGFTTTEGRLARRFSLEVFPALLGRMGWGQSLPAMLPFAAFFLGGLVVALRFWKGRERRESVVLAVAMLVYFAIQSWMLRVSRFEVRYYSSLVPLMILFASIGIEGAVRWTAGRVRTLPAPVLRGLLAVPLAAWLSVSLWCVLTLSCRGFNYKAIAAWINEHVPQNGIYAFYNVYELRGVPNAYATPGRFGTSVAAWSSEEDYERVNPPQRAVSFFTRFPRAYFVEIAPGDLLAPEAGEKPIPRDRLFTKSLWLGDPAWEHLMKLRTFPPGEVQINAENMHRVLISYNEPRDLPLLAQKNGQPFYHYFGEEWQYVRDQRMNDFRGIGDSGTLFVGNASGEAAVADLTIHCLASPNGCRVAVFDPKGRKLVADAPVPAQYHQLRIPGVVLQPGTTTLMVQVLPPPNEVRGELFVYALMLEPAKPPQAPYAVQSN